MKKFLQGAFSSVPLFAVALVFLYTWIEPGRLGRQAVREQMYVMLLEFLVIHSTIFLGATAASEKVLKRKIAKVTGLVLFYSVFAGVLSTALGRYWPIVWFWVLTAVKIPSIIGAPPVTYKQWMLRGHYAAMCVCYGLVVIVTSILPVPELGITEAILRAQDFQSEGLWVDQPQRVIAAGFFYFLLMGFYGLWSAVPDRKETSRASSCDVP